MALNALDMRTRAPRLRWSSETRKFLCCLVKYFDKDNSGFQAVFNARFRKELTESGFKEEEFIKWDTLNSQWADMKFKKDSIWKDIHQSDSSPEAWLPYIKTIEDTAASIGQHLDRKLLISVETSEFTYQTPVPRAETDAERQLFQAEISIEPPRVHADPVQDLANDPFENTTLQQKDTKHALSQPEPVPLCRPGTKCYWCDIESLNEKAINGAGGTQLPPLLYRWWNVKSQGLNLENSFVAGMFASLLEGYFEPDTITEDEFDNLFESHIRRKQLPSPFISTFQSMLAPVHRGLREGKGASIAIFDSRRITSKVYSARSFVEKHKLRGKIGRTYHGGGEYLIWGWINNAVICSFEVATILSIAAQHQDIHEFLQLDLISSFPRARWPLHQAMAKGALFLDKQAGATVGKLLSLLEVPQEFCRTVSEGIAYSWRMKNKHIPWGDFFYGVELGYRGEPVMAALRTPENTPESNGGIPCGRFDSEFEIIDLSSDDEGNGSDATTDYPDKDNEHDKDVVEPMDESRNAVAISPARREC
ncbi:uncharacterized protein DSM5745_08788 [Aspergillus mulundensis]|uniref:DUF7587 domain-containing protein n=1 Tax=Aspergillus mulundensis TaxID=1810919 RepID=A0A3D8R4Y4_9EURO|nr:hypothetical protein DSM5745_08788 [Aspergillus mulundensis]RDW69028.1 hypothetical protein DSM5745_08788 [Aspergillus mulundensis]